MNTPAPTPAPKLPPHITAPYWPWLAAALALVATPTALLFGVELWRVAMVWGVEWALLFFFAFLMRQK